MSCLRRTLIATFAFALSWLFCHAACVPSTASAADCAAALNCALATVTQAELRHHVGLLADDSLEGREAGSRGGRAAARYIEEQLHTAQLQPAGSVGGYAQRFRGDCQNLLALLPGSDPRLVHEVLLIGAHYDHVGYGNRKTSNGPWGFVHNGADDNASGVAAVLELVDAAHRVEWRPRRSVLFAFWDAEEQGLLGSRHWVAEPTRSLASVKMAINVDMVGRMVDERLEVPGTRTGVGLRRLLSARDLPEKLRLDFTWEYKENSDHWPLFQAGVPSICIHTGLHEDYHRPSDDLEKLNLPGMQLATAYLIQTAFRLADEELLPAFRPAAVSETPSIQRLREQMLAPIASRIGVGWRDRPTAHGLAVEAEVVDAGSTAEAAGVRRGDRVIAMDGQTVRDASELAARLLLATDHLTLTLVRGSEEFERDVALTGGPVRIGLAWREDPAEPGQVYITRVVPDSRADFGGLAPGDRLRALHGEPVAGSQSLLDRLERTLAAGTDVLVWEVERDGRVFDVSIEVQIDAQSAASGDAEL